MAAIRFIDWEGTDPYFNIALEEYLLKHFQEDFVLLYRNRPSVIVGKHQNTAAEINMRYVQAHRLPVVRRISGGGTVYHDEGNLNYTLIRSGEAGKLVDFQYYARPVTEALAKLGVASYFAKKNSIFAGDKKISGNAEHVFKNRVLHHGTLLFSSDLDALNEAITVNTGSFRSRAVASVRSTVTNISGQLDKAMTIAGFKAHLFEAFGSHYPDGVFYTLTETDHQAVEKLMEDRYKRHDWNFGYSPDYVFEQSKEAGGKTYTVRLEVEKSVISQVSVMHEGLRLIGTEQLVIMRLHDWDTLSASLRVKPHELSALPTDEVLGLFFG